MENNAHAGAVSVCLSGCSGAGTTSVLQISTTSSNNTFSVSDSQPCPLKNAGGRDCIFPPQPRPHPCASCLASLHLPSQPVPTHASRLAPLHLPPSSPASPAPSPTMRLPSRSPPSSPSPPPTHVPSRSPPSSQPSPVLPSRSPPSSLPSPVPTPPCASRLAPPTHAPPVSLPSLPSPPSSLPNPVHLYIHLPSTTTHALSRSSAALATKREPKHRRCFWEKQSSKTTSERQ